jgi:superoxide reductase
MGLVKENSVDAAKEKHVPVIVKEPGGFKVSVGSVTHPSEEKHYIEWIELVTGGVTQRRFLKPGDKPEATFSSPEATGFARAYCNLHGLWKS